MHDTYGSIFHRYLCKISVLTVDAVCGIMERKMINLAIVEDEENIASQIKQYIARYMEENDMPYSLSTFSSAESFLFSDVNAFDIILMDIQLPKMDGVTAVRKLRETNDYVTVVFVTSLAQYAITGYEVGALDFMVKPLSYYNFALKFRRAVNTVNRKLDDTIVVHSKTQTNVFRISDIYYVEIVAHTVTYHTKNGVYTTTGTMKKVCEGLIHYPFSLCNQCYLVNLRYVTQVDGTTVTVADKKLAMSRPRRKEFMHDLNEYLAGNAKGGGS